MADLAAGVALWPLKPPLQAGGVEHLADLADLDRAVVNFSKPPLQAGGVGHLADLADLSKLGGACEERFYPVTILLGLTRPRAPWR